MTAGKRTAAAAGGIEKRHASKTSNSGNTKGQSF
jgi:hypothetical protein